MKTKIRFIIILTLTFFQIIPMCLFRFIPIQRNNQDLKTDSYFLAMPNEIKLQIIKEGIKSIIYNEDDLKISISKVCNFLDALSKINKELREFQYFFKKDLIKYVRFLKKKRELDLALKNVLLNEPENNSSKNKVIDLIQKGADPNVFIDELSTLNFIAKSKKFNDLFNILIDHGASINLKDELTENTPLINACISNNINIVKTLLNNPKTNVNAFNKSGNTALFEAAAKQDANLVNMLFDNPNVDIYHYNNLGDNFICYSCIKTYGDTDNLFKLFLNNKKIKFDINFQNKLKRTLLISAIIYKKHTIIKIILAHPDVDVNIQDDYGRTALFWAIDKDNVEIAKILLNRLDIDVNIQDNGGNTALFYTIDKDNVEIAKILLNHPDIDVNIKSKYHGTVFMYAIDKNNVEIAKILLNRSDIDVNIQDNYSQTVLFWAIDKNNVEIAKILLNRSDIDVNIQDNYGQTVLFWAIDKNNVEIAQILLDHPDIDVNIQDNGGSTALFWAIDKNNVEIAQILLAHPDIITNFKNKCLKVALINLRNIYYNMIKILNSENNNCAKILDYARSLENNKEMIKFLLKQKILKTDIEYNYSDIDVEFLIEFDERFSIQNLELNKSLIDYSEFKKLIEAKACEISNFLSNDFNRNNVYESDLVVSDNTRYKVLIFLEVIIKKLWENLILVKDQTYDWELKKFLKLKKKKF